MLQTMKSEHDIYPQKMEQLIGLSSDYQQHTDITTNILSLAN